MTIRPVALVDAPLPANDKPISGMRVRRFSYTGTIPKGAIYVEREADRILPDALADGEYCHVFGPRQIGKSSLRSRVTKNLTMRGIRCASIDMEGFGTSATPDQWFYAFVELIADKLHLANPIDFWQRHIHVSPARRWGLYLRHIMQHEIVDRRCVLLLDEIEAVQLVSFPTDDFFLILRELFEARSDEPNLERLSICLMGVTVPDDLLKEKRSTPFNISRRVHLDDFTRVEMDALAPGLDDLGASTPALLDAVYAWTDGHPYMTMRTCEAAYQRGPVEKGQEQTVVDAVVQDLFLAHAMDDANLRYASDRFTNAAFDKPDLPLMEKVLLLRRLLDGERVPADLESSVQMELHLCGMIKGFSDSDGEWVRTRNRIFASVFDAQWLQSRGDRRYLGGALWKWLESGKNKDYLLRGEALSEALTRDVRLWTNEEREFLVEGLREDIAFMEGQVRMGLTAQLGLDTGVRTFPEVAESMAIDAVATDQIIRWFIKGLALVGVLSLVLGVASALYQNTIAALYYGIPGIGFVILAGAAWRKIEPARKVLNDSRDKIRSFRTRVTRIESLGRQLQQLVDEGEAKLAKLRAYLERLS